MNTIWRLKVTIESNYCFRYHIWVTIAHGMHEFTLLHVFVVLLLWIVGRKFRACAYLVSLEEVEKINAKDVKGF
jgi:hypothetical protein